MESFSGILSRLTDDLLAIILTKLDDDGSDLKSFRAVCKSFHRVESTHKTSLRVLRTQFLSNLLRNYSKVDTLDLSVCPRIDDVTVAALLSGTSELGWTRRLRRLVLSRSAGLRSAGLEMLVRSCTRLEAIDVSYCCGFGDWEAAALSCAVWLREVWMDKCLGLSDVGLAKIAVGCEKLERLSVKWCLEIGDLGLDLLSKKCLYLKHLDISYMKVTSESLRSISAMQKLEVLVMVGCGLVDDVGLHYLENGCPSLQVIDVSRCEKVSSSGLISVIRGRNGLLRLSAGYYFFVSSSPDINKLRTLCLLILLQAQALTFDLNIFVYQELSTTVLHWFKNLNNLKTFRVDGARLSDSALQIIGINCRSLVDLGFSKCKGVTDTGIMQLVSGCTKLKIFDLTCCNALTDKAISAIANSCRNLVCLKLESCNLLTEKSLDHLGSCCFLLEELDLTDCSGVNDRGLDYMSKCSELICLRLGHCTNFSDKGLSYIASNCSKIRELDLYRCKNIGDDGLAALANGCRKLKKLNLSYCLKISDKGMEYLGYLTELSDLEMRSLLNITSAGLASIAFGCKRLSELDLKNCKSITDSGFWALAYYSRNLLQINLSYCGITDVGLCMLMANLTRLQDAKLVNLPNVSTYGIELALRASCTRLKKVKMLASVRIHLSPEILETLQARSCKIRWE